MKICSKCGQSKPLDEFSNESFRADGKRPHCKECRSNAQRQYAQLHQEQIRAYRRTYRIFNREKLCQSDKEYNLGPMREKILAQKRNYGNARYPQIKNQVAMNRRKWRAHNPEHSRELCRKRRAMMRNVIVDLTVGQWESVKSAYNHKCVYCGQRLSLTMDHVVPISKGGNHTIDNVVPACVSCNSRKHASSAPIFQRALLF